MIGGFRRVDRKTMSGLGLLSSGGCDDFTATGRPFVLALALAAGALGSASAQQGDRFYVIGVVRKPGSYPHTANMTVGDALTRAGGFARQAAGLEIIRIVDGEKQTMGVTLNDAVLPNDTVNAKP